MSVKLWESKLAVATANYVGTRQNLEAQRAGQLVLLAKPDDPAPKPVAQTLFEAHPLHRKMDLAIREGTAGICLKGKAQTDFVDFRFLCDNGWNGIDGASLATAGHALDKTNAEIKELMDDPEEVKKP